MNGQKEKTKKQKLIVQISIITVIMFVVTLVFTSISDYLITRNSYLSSKNEMIDRDLKNYDQNLSDNRAYCIDLMKSDGENIIKNLTKDEIELRSSDEVKNSLFGLMMSKDKIDYDSIDDVIRRFYFKDLFQTLTMYLDAEVKETKYSSISLIDFQDEKPLIFTFGVRLMNLIQ